MGDWDSAPRTRLLVMTFKAAVLLSGISIPSIWDGFMVAAALPLTILRGRVFGSEPG